MRDLCKRNKASRLAMAHHLSKGIEKSNEKSAQLTAIYVPNAPEINAQHEYT
jgi:hypothetical protein